MQQAIIIIDDENLLLQHIKIADSMASRNRLQSYIKSDSYLVESSRPI